MLITWLIVLAALAFAGPVFASSGDYGVNTGASSQSDHCLMNENIPCFLNWNGYGLTFASASNGWAKYTFDDFDCTVTLNISNHSQNGARGPECDQYQI